MCPAGVYTRASLQKYTGLSTNLYTSLHIFLYMCLCSCLHACLFTYIHPIHMSIHMSLHMSIHMSLHMSKHMSKHVSLRLSLHRPLMNHLIIEECISTSARSLRVTADCLGMVKLLGFKVPCSFRCVKQLGGCSLTGSMTGSWTAHGPLMDRSWTAHCWLHRRLYLTVAVMVH